MVEETNILVADPDEEFLSELEKAFSKTELNVTVAASGTDALAAARDETCDVALVERELPDMDGAMVVQLLAKRHPALLTAMMTDVASAGPALEALEAGVARCWLKPFDRPSHVPRLLRELNRERDFYLRRRLALRAVDDDKPAADEEVPIKVLVVEPDAATREELAVALFEAGFGVTESICGQDALLRLNTDPFDVVVATQDLGDMTADDVLGRSRRVSENTGVVVAAAAPSMLFANALIRNAADGYVADPVAETERFHAAIQSAGRVARLLESGITVDELIDRATPNAID